MGGPFNSHLQAQATLAATSDQVDTKVRLHHRATNSIREVLHQVAVLSLEGAPRLRRCHGEMRIHAFSRMAQQGALRPLGRHIWIRASARSPMAQDFKHHPARELGMFPGLNLFKQAIVSRLLRKALLEVPFHRQAPFHLPLLSAQGQPLVIMVEIKRRLEVALATLCCFQRVVLAEALHRCHTPNCQPS